MANENPPVALIELDGNAIGLAVMDGPITRIREHLEDFPDESTVRILPKSDAVEKFQSDFGRR